MGKLSERLEVAIRHRVGGMAVDVSFALRESWTVLFGPSGVGKSTVLRVIAGLVKPDAGRVVSFDGTGAGTVLTDMAMGIFVAPHRRGVRFVGQQAALFPHLSVRENVAYGMAPGEAGLGEIVRLCRVQHLMERMPAEISGGERQRVALARALGAGAGRVLLLDEPFSGVDVGLREEVVRDVRAWLEAQGVPVLQVTHDVGEVFAAGAEVIRMDGGRVVAQGVAEVVLRPERDWLMGRLEVGRNADFPSGMRNR